MVYIKSLNKTIFPNYVPPIEDELFSSWLCRLSMAHDIKPLSFIQNYFGREYPVWNRDIDMLAPSYLINFMLKHTLLNEERLDNLFLKSLQYKAYKNWNYKGLTNNIIPLGIKHRKRKKYGQLYCPSCFKKNTPYYKKNWRLLTSLVCVSCNSYLYDKCPKCLSPIAFFRVNMSDVNISIVEQRLLCFCHNCGYDLRETEVIKSPSEKEIKYQIFIDETIKKGYNELSQYSFLFLKGIFIMANKLRSNCKNNQFRKAILRNLNIDLPTINTSFRLSNIEQRRETLNIIYLLLEEYPNKLNNILESGNVTTSRIHDDRESIPYWLEENIVFRSKKHIAKHLY